MNKIYRLEDSFEASHHCLAMRRRQGAHNIPLKRNLFIPLFNEEVNFIRGFMLDFDNEKEEFHYPDGNGGTRTIVKFWKVVPYENWKRFNSGIELAEREKLIVTIPFHIIDINNVTYD